MAIEYMNLETIKLLLSNATAKPDPTHGSVESQLLQVVQNDRENVQEVLALLLEAGANVNMRNALGFSLLMQSVRAGSMAAFRTVLTYRPDLEARSRGEDTALTTITHSTPAAMVKLMLASGASLNVANNSGKSPLIAAVGARNSEVVEFLLVQGAVRSSIDAPSEFGTALHHAILLNDLEIARLLIDNGADVNFALSDLHGTPLMIAIRKGSEEAAALLIEKGAHVTTDAITMAVLMAVSLDLIEMLLRGPDMSVSGSDTFGRRPVHLACYNGGIRLLDALKIPDDDFAARDCVGRTPLHYACLSGNIGLAEEVLIRSSRVGVDVEVADSEGWTTLLWAARACDNLGRVFDPVSPEGHCNMIKWLLSKGSKADVSTQKGFDDPNDGQGADGHKWTAIDIARYHQADFTILETLENQTPVDLKRPPLTQSIGAATYKYCACCFLVSSQVWKVVPSAR